MTRGTTYFLLLCTVAFCYGEIQAQNCSALKNLERMTVAKKPDLNKLGHISIEGSSIYTTEHYKFVQVRNSHTFICLPKDFRGPVVDFKALLRPNDQTSMVLDGNIPLVHLRCHSRNDDCQHYRCGKQCVSCGGGCANARWISSTLPGSRLVIIPTFKSRT